MKLPDLGDSATAVVVVEWRVAVGDRVAADQTLLTVETDKVDTDVPSPVSGVVVELLVESGAEVGIGEALCVIDS
ncbi:MAG TPA: biotin/lipoyl-containing protein [Acidimicrobiia bacterium]|nr:biotin/lipoyl-containing protein [Acidimicrobiia bacterium]